MNIIKPVVPPGGIVHPAWHDTREQYCTVLDRLYIIPGGIADYHHLSRYHYRSTHPGPVAGIWAVRQCRSQHDEDEKPVAVIVYTYPAPNLAVRNRVTNHFFHHADKRTALALLNRNVRCISRVIVDPRWRDLGIASWLVSQTMPLLNVAMIESMAVMGQFHPFLKHAGMRQFIPPVNPRTQRLIAMLEQLKIGRQFWYDPDAVQVRMDCLDEQQAKRLDNCINAFLGRFGSRRKMMWGIERTAFVLERLSYPWMYFAWLNTNAAVAGLQLYQNADKTQHASLSSRRRPGSSRDRWIPGQARNDKDDNHPLSVEAADVA